MAVKKKFPYKAALVACSGGKQRCTYGCIGCGACAAACRFGAVAFDENGVAGIDESACIACGTCVRVCPQKIIRIHECANYIVVKCASQDKEAAAGCLTGCTGCGICERGCTAGAVQVVENRAVIDEEICLSCGMCAVNCPRHAVYDLRGILTTRYGGY